MRHTKHYVEFFYPGLIMSDTTVHEVDHRDATRIDIESPEGSRYGKAFAFRFFDRAYVWATDEEGERFERKVKDRHHESPYYYPGASLHTQAEVEALNPGGYLLDNMRSNGWDRAIRTCRGNWQAYEAGKTVVL